MFWVKRLSRLAAEAAGWLIIPMMLIVVLDAALRGFFNYAMDGVAELSSLLLVTMIYFGLAGAQSRGANFRVSFIDTRLSPAWNRALLVALSVIVIVSLALVIYFTFNAAAYSFARNETSYGLIQFPIWPARAVVCAGLLLLLVQFLADTVLLIVEGRHPYLEEAEPSRDTLPASGD